MVFRISSSHMLLGGVLGGPTESLAGLWIKWRTNETGGVDGGEVESKTIWRER